MERFCTLMIVREYGPRIASDVCLPVCYIPKTSGVCVCCSNIIDCCSDRRPVRNKPVVRGRDKNWTVIIYITCKKNTKLLINASYNNYQETILPIYFTTADF